MTALFIGLALLYAAWRDYRERIIPNPLTFGLICLGITKALYYHSFDWKAFVLAFGMALLYYFGGHWAEGDVKLIIALGFWLTFQQIEWLLMLYGLLALGTGIGWMVRHRTTKLNLSYPAGVVIFLSYIIAPILNKTLVFLMV